MNNEEKYQKIIKEIKKLSTNDTVINLCDLVNELEMETVPYKSPKKKIIIDSCDKFESGINDYIKRYY